MLRRFSFPATTRTAATATRQCNPFLRCSSSSLLLAQVAFCSTTAKMGDTFAKAGYSSQLKTPSFGDIGNMPAPPELGPVTTSAATNVDLARDLHGPWVFLAAPNLEGELFVRKDGIVFFRPGNCLGYGIGKLTLVQSAATATSLAQIELETYLYESTSKEPPLEPTRLKFAVSLSVASAAAQKYKTFTMHGQALLIQSSNNSNIISGGDVKNVGAVNAAKLEPWDSDKFGQEWQPNPQIAEGFDILFPRKLSLSRNQGTTTTIATKQQQQSLDLKQYKVGPVDSVFYVPDYVTREEEAECLAQNRDTPAELKNALDRRVVQEYGGTMCPECNKSFVSDANIPPYCNEICRALVSDAVFHPTTFPNNVRIHDYEPGHGIAPHVDGPIYVPRVAILSLASSVLMSFYPRREPYADVMEHYNDTFKFDGDIARQTPLFSLVLEPRSLLVFEKDAYTFHPHGIGAGEVDSLDEAKVGPIVNKHLLRETDYSSDKKELKRKHRVGITIRNLLPRCSHEPQRAEYQMLQACRVRRPEWFLNNNGSDDNKSQASDKVNSGYSAMSKLPPPTAPVPSSNSHLEAKLDRLLQRQENIESQLKEIQTLLAFNTQRNVKFESDVAGVLDHVSQLVLEMHARVEDIADEQEQLKRGK